jgi:hypothetical protein
VPARVGPVLAPLANGTHAERAEPRLTWTDSRTAPTGDFAAWAIPHARLATLGIPRRGDTWDAVSDFALSYDGHAYWSDLPELANRVLQRWTRTRALPDTLDEIRGCLFYEQRRWHHFGEEPTGRSADYIWALVDAVGVRAFPVTRPLTRVPDPRPATAPEAHVKLVPAPMPAESVAVGAATAMASAPELRPVPAGGPGVGPIPKWVTHLTPVTAAENHVRLVSTIESDAGSVSRHPSGQARTGPASRHPAGHAMDRPPLPGARRDLRPMPSADPLPKPPVIVRRLRPATSVRPPVRGANGTATGTGTGTGTGTRSSPGAWWNPHHDEHDGDPRAERDAVVTFGSDDSRFRTWLNAHPDGYVLNRTEAGSKTPTLHRSGCAAIQARPRAGAAATRALKVCGPSAEALRAWSAAQGSVHPTACRRCHP